MSASDNVKVIPVPPDLVPQMLPAALPFVVRGLATADEDLALLSEELMDRRAVLWCIFADDNLTGAFFSAVHDDAACGKAITAYGLGGIEPRRWADLARNSIECLGRSNGCGAACFFGRSGWARFFPQYERSRVASNIWHFRRALQ